MADFTTSVGRIKTRAARFLVDRYATVDTRTLGLFRILFGFLLLLNLYDRTQGPDAIAFYTNDGVLPNHYALFAPMGPRIWSLLFTFSTPAEVQVAFTLIAVVYVAYIVGYRTKLAQILAVVCLLSLDNRNLILQNGGIVVTNVVAIWSAFLPLGKRFSVDAVLRAPGPGEEEGRVARFAYFAVLVNFAAIYLFNCLHKVGITWHDGSAVHWVLWQNRIATFFAAWLRMHEAHWLSPILTRGTLLMEGALPALILSPIWQKWTRRAAIVFIIALHSGISATMTLGPFSYSMMSFSVLLIGSWDWDKVARSKPLSALGARVSARAREVVEKVRGYLSEPNAVARGADSTDAPSGLSRAKASILRAFGEALSIALFVCVIVQVGMDNWAIPEKYRIKHRPEVMGDVIDYLRIPQGWSMFSPEAPKDDGLVVVDAVLDDGQHIDPLTGLPPDFEAGLHGPWYQDQQWCDYSLRMKWKDSGHLYPYFRDYIATLDRYKNWPRTAKIRYFDVYWVNNAAPPPGSTTPFDIRTTFLFSGGTRTAGAPSPRPNGR